MDQNRGHGQGQGDAMADQVKDTKISFPFPFTPYNVQEDLMTQMYHTLERRGRVGIFESPTGTGKSLSIICSALHWLKSRPIDADALASSDDEEKESGDGKEDLKKQGGELSWITDFDEEAKGEEKRNRREKRLRRLRRVQGRLQRLLAGDKAAKRRKQLQVLRAREKQREKALESGYMGSGSGINWDDEFVLNDYESDGDNNLRIQKDKRQLSITSMKNARYSRYGSSDDDNDDDIPLSATTSASSSSFGRSPALHIGGIRKEDESDSDEDEDIGMLQIFYCSHTHSQLSQFVQEIRKTVFGDGSRGVDGTIRVVSLGSRKTLCINSKVMKLQSDGRINDRCLDMQKKKKDGEEGADAGSDEKMSFIAGQGRKSKNKRKWGMRKPQSSCRYFDHSLRGNYRDHALVKVHDIESLAQLGRRLQSCPYYGSRASVPFAELITMPYSMLLHRGTRESLGLRLKNNVVIFDEAHNIIDAVNNIHSVTVTLSHCSMALSQLSAYRERYANRLKAKNIFYVDQILSMLRALVKYIKGAKLKPSSTSTSAMGKPAAKSTAYNGQDDVMSTLVSTNDFTFAAQIDNINLFKIERYLARSQICKKLHGFVEKQQEKEGIVATESASSSSPVYISTHVSSLQIVHNFLMALTNADSDGRILLTRQPISELGQSSLKFVMLNPAVHFREIVDQARNVILCGGTMEPVSDVVQQLFSHIANDKIDLFACGHIIPPEQLLPMVASKGPSGTTFEFTFAKRSTPAQMDELGRLLENMTKIVPEGIVMFLPSYAYEESLLKYWRSQGVLSRLKKRKQVFREPKLAKDIDEMLQGYSEALKGAKGGAILFCVVGGKMSEGINFSDGLARAVVMVGLPFPNNRSPELIEKMAYLNACAVSNGLQHASPNEISVVNAKVGEVAKLSGSTHKNVAGSAGREYYENVCMKAVNQSIGRAIRHKGDYSTIILVDHRYKRNNICNKLPGWIRKRLYTPSSFGQMFGLTAKFFAAQRKRVAADAAAITTVTYSD